MALYSDVVIGVSGGELGTLPSSLFDHPLPGFDSLEPRFCGQGFCREISACKEMYILPQYWLDQRDATRRGRLNAGLWADTSSLGNSRFHSSSFSSKSEPGLAPGVDESPETTLMGLDKLAVAQFGKSAWVSMAAYRRAQHNKNLTNHVRVPGSSPGSQTFPMISTQVFSTRRKIVSKPVKTGVPA